jgi:histidine phosphotransferase ChpT
MSEQTRLAGLIASKICHDLINPISMAANSLDMLADAGNSELHEEARELLAMSTRSAHVRATFLRAALGAGFAHEGPMNLDKARDEAQRYMTSQKATLQWNAPSAEMEAVWSRLALNLISILVEGLFRGGTLSVTADPTDGGYLRVKAEGPMVILKDYVVPGLTGVTDPASLKVAHEAHPVFTAMIAAERGLKITINAGEGFQEAIVSPVS